MTTKAIDNILDPGSFPTSALHLGIMLINNILFFVKCNVLSNFYHYYVAFAWLSQVERKRGKQNKLSINPVSYSPIS